MKPSRLLLPLLLSASWSLAADWPQWRGANRDDRSPDRSILANWPKEGPKQLWLSREGGLGYSGFSVVKGRLYTMGAMDDGEYVLCLDAESGKTIWKSKIDSRVYENNWGNGPRSTPTIDGDFAYALSANGILACLSTKDGKVQWTADFIKDFGGELQSWGYTESVLIDGDRLYCTPGGSQGTMAALNKKTGKVIWRSTGLTDQAQYSSPILIQHQGRPQLVQLVMRKVFGLDPASGDVLWKADFPGRTAVIPTPIYHDGHLFLTAGYGVGCRLLKLDGAEPEVVYEERDITNHHGGVILVDGNLYGHSDRKGWTCQDFLSGDIRWQDEEVLSKGCIGYAAGHFICVGETDGTVVIIEASPEKWKEKGRFQLQPQTKNRKPQGRIWVHPVIVNGRLYLRDQEMIYCYDVKGS